MRTQIVSIEDMSAHEIVQWNAWASRDGELTSPYLRFEFTETVARARRDVRIAVFEDDQGLAGFFPHHRPHGGVVRPVGAPMSDYQGAIAREPGLLDPKLVARATGASAFVYENWLGTGDTPAAGTRSREDSQIVDLAAGPEGYFEAQRGLHRDHFRKTARRLRAAERDHGPVRVVLGDPKGEAFNRLSGWKQAQYRATGKLNVLGIDWVRHVLTDLRKREGQDFSGLTASLWFGDRLAAAEFGLVAGDVYHSWFPAYDPDLAKYSPGLLLLHGLFEQAPERGLTRIDLGKGGDHYKKYYANRSVPLDQGRVLSPGLAALGVAGWDLAERAAGVLPGRLAHLPARLRNRWSQVSAFEPRMGPRLTSLAMSISL